MKHSAFRFIQFRGFHVICVRCSHSYRMSHTLWWLHFDGQADEIHEERVKRVEKFPTMRSNSWLWEQRKCKMQSIQWNELASRDSSNKQIDFHRASVDSFELWKRHKMKTSSDCWWHSIPYPSSFEIYPNIQNVHRQQWKPLTFFFHFFAGSHFLMIYTF